MEKTKKTSNFDWHKYNMPNKDDSLVDITIHTKTGKVFTMLDNIDFPERSLLSKLLNEDTNYVAFLTGIREESIFIPKDNIDYIHIGSPRGLYDEPQPERINEKK